MSIDTLIARPYAHAVFELAVANNDLQQWTDALDILSQIAQNEQAHMLLFDPRLSWQQRADFFLAIYQQDATITNFIKLLALNKRLQYLPLIAKIFTELCAKRENVAQAKIVSVVTLTEQQKTNLLSRLKQRYQSNIQAQFTVDKNLLGGMVIHICDQVIDSSLCNQLAKLQAKLMRG